MIVHEQAFWLVIGLFYLSRQFRFLPCDGACVFITLTGRLNVMLPAQPFETTLGLLTILNPLAPSRVVVSGRWGKSSLDAPADLERDWSSLAGLTRTLAGARVIAAVAFVVLFVLGPALTWLYGLGRALLLVAPVWICIYGAVLYLLLFGTLSALGIKVNTGMLLFECLVCPGYVPALPAMLARNARMLVDVCWFARRYQRPADWARLAGIISRRIAHDIDDDPARAAALERYRSLLLQ